MVYVRLGAWLLLGVAIIIASVALLNSRPAPTEIVVRPPLPTATPAPTNTPEPILVYVTGAVNKSETVVEVQYGSRVMDVIEASGGFSDDADLTAINPAAIVRDGDQIHVQRIGERAIIPTPPGNTLVHINIASVDELSELPGIGEVLANSIIDYRTQHGPFLSFEDLEEVTGIGPSMIENLQELIVFDG